MAVRNDGIGVLYVAFIACMVTSVTASIGDRSLHYRKCIKKCSDGNCSGDSLLDFQLNQQLYLKLTGWDCPSECEYNCMWRTVEYFVSGNRSIPQFHGKWPFIRILGIQEPASTVFSIFNGLVHIIGIIEFRKRLPIGAPMYWVWHTFAAVGVHAWFWSSVFHTRDVLLTERMDYFSAAALLLMTIYALGIRSLCYHKSTCRREVAIGFAILLLILFSLHVSYLTFVTFDYGYNMKASVIAGLVNSFWMIKWASSNWDLHGGIKKALVATVSVNVLCTLELLDFSPFFWIFDAHAVWHLSTVLPAIWLYSYIIEDSLYLYKTKHRFKKLE